jgi:protein SCO1/2
VSSKPLRIAAVAAAALVALALGAFTASRLSAPGATKPLVSGTRLSQPRALAPFTLTDQDGQAFTQAQLRGHWTLLFAGFTHCPDVCPTTLALMAQLREKLGAAGGPLDLVFLSVDPGRDTPERLKTYVAHFGAGIRGVTAAGAQLDALCANLGLAYVKVPGANAADYTVDHSTALVLLDPEGRIAAYFQAPHRLDTLAADLSGIVGT